MSAPSPAHEERRTALDTIAVLAGFQTSYPVALPDGRRPDVLRVDFRSPGLFIGEAKETEGPDDTASRERLLAYLRWGASVVGPKKRLVVMVCAGDVRAAGGWLSFLGEAAGKVGMEDVRTSVGDLMGWGIAVLRAASP